MRWENRRRSTNVEDRRGSGGRMGRMRLPRGGRISLPSGRSTRRAGGSSILMLVVIGLALWIFAGINPLQLLAILAGGGNGTVMTDSRPAPAPRTAEQKAADDRRADFLSVVLAETETTWNGIFEASGSRYDAPTLVLYTGFTNTGCGTGSAAAGPFYCPLDEKVYIDTSFFDTLERRFDAPGDFAQAYVLAHEVGHHVQNETGVLGEYHNQRSRLGERRANALSVRVELQADCYAGVWAHNADRSGIVEEGDIEEALGAAAAVGDDTLQRRTQGYVVPESFNHGTAQQRSRWFRIGYKSGNPADCDTFDAATL